MQYAGFVGGSNESGARAADVERTVNLYPEVVGGQGGKAPMALYNAPGWVTLYTLPTSPVRGLYTLNGQTFAVAGDSLYELAVSGFGRSLAITGATLRGSAMNNPDNGPVTMASNGDGGFQLFVSSGGFGYCYDLRTKTLTFVLDDADRVGFIDGFFLTLSPLTSSFRISALEDGSLGAWDPTQIAQRNDAPDKWLSFLIYNKEIWLFGSQTSDVWYDAGTAPFPFTPNPSVYLQYGLAAPATAAILDNAPMFLGQSLDGGAMVYRAEGYAPVRVSTHAMEKALLGYATITDAEAFVYQEDGHSFYVLTFPTAAATWVYDAATGLWHERGDWNGYTFTGLRTRGHVFVSGAHLVGDRTSGALYRQGIDLYTDPAGQGIVRLRQAAHLSTELRRNVYDRFQLDLDPGVGLASGQGSDPIAYLQWSNDGGNTWSDPQAATIGKAGEYGTRAIWRRLGSGRDRIFRVTASDPVPHRWIDAYLDVRGGAA